MAAKSSVPDSSCDTTVDKSETAEKVILSSQFPIASGSEAVWLEDGSAKIGLVADPNRLMQINAAIQREIEDLAPQRLF